MRWSTALWGVVFAMLAPTGACRCDLSARTDDGRLAWRDVGDGLSYSRLEALGTHFHLLQVPLKHFEVFAADARTPDRQVAPVEELRLETGAVAAVNGTFFDDKQQPLGLLVSDGEEINPLRDISWWAVMAISEVEGERSAVLLTTGEFKALDESARQRIRFALQVGPRTVVDGRPLKLKVQSAARSAVCITNPGELVLLTSEGNLVESNALARLMAEDEADGGLGCKWGLMLDGGPSAQLEVAADDFTLSVKGGVSVSNALAVRRAANPER